MSIMTGAHAEDRMMSREGILADTEKKITVGRIASTCEDKPEAFKKEDGFLEESEEQAMPEILPATGGRESEVEQGEIDRDRLVYTGKTCGESDATVHVEASVGEETAETLTCDSLTEEANVAHKSPRMQSNSPGGNSADRLMAVETSVDNVKPGACRDVDEAGMPEKVGGCKATDVLINSLTEDLEEICLRASERKLGPLDCPREEPEGKAVEETMNKLAQLRPCMVDLSSQLTFHEAVRAGDDKCVAALLASGAVENLNEPDWNVSGDPPLLVAASNHSLPILSLLLANGCEPGVRSPRGESALHRAILNGASAEMILNLVEELLKYDCPASVKEAGGGSTALHVLTRQLANAQASKNLHRNFDAALKALQLLAKAGPINAKDHQGRSALHILASSTGFADSSSQTREMESMLESFLAAGADPSLKNDRGETPLHESLECGALSTAFLLIPHTPTGLTSRYGETPLHIASRKNYVDVLAKLLERGEDPSVQDAGGNTPLHLASARGFHQTVSLLVISPLAQLEKPNTDGLTALQVAAESGFVNTVKLLLKAGADPSQTVHYCATTLHRHPDISVLIDHELTRRRQLAA